MHYDTLKRLLFADPVDMQQRTHNHLIERLEQFGFTPGRESATSMVQMLDGWNRYAHAHRQMPWNEDKTPIGEDYYARPAFLEIGKALTHLLNMDSRSTLDSGKLHSFILDTLHTNGFTEKETA
jgi:hypothetical protein